MAYQVSIFRQCYAKPCNKQATQRVYGQNNEDLGQFCTPHAKQELKRQTQMEREGVAPAEGSV